MDNSLFKNLPNVAANGLEEDSISLLNHAALLAEFELNEALEELNDSGGSLARFRALSAGIESYGDEVTPTTESVIDFAISSLESDLKTPDSGDTLTYRLKTGIKRAWAAVVKFLRKISDWLRTKLAAFMDWLAKAPAAYRRKYNHIQKLPSDAVITVKTWQLESQTGELTNSNTTLDPTNTGYTVGDNSGDRLTAEDEVGDTQVIGGIRYTYNRQSETTDAEPLDEKREYQMTKAEAMLQLSKLNSLTTNASKTLLGYKLKFRDVGKFKPEESPTPAQEEEARAKMKSAKYLTSYLLKTFRARVKATGEIYKDVNDAAKKYSGPK